MKRVLFVCTHNSARSQMAEGLLGDRHGGSYEARSAGTNPRGVHPMAIEVMEEIGIDISHHTSKSIDAVLEEIGAEVPAGAENKSSESSLDVVVTFCEDAEENCPYVPARHGNVHAGFEDLSAAEGTEEEWQKAFRRVRGELAEWIDVAFGATTDVGIVPVRPAEASDLGAVQTLLRACDLPCDDLTPAYLQHFLVAGDGGSICGVVGLEPRCEVALLRSLAVSPGARNEGLGTRLLDAIEQRARRDDISALYLLTTTASDYFQAHGYERIDRDALPKAIQETEEASRLCPSSATAMRKTP